MLTDAETQPPSDDIEVRLRQAVVSYCNHPKSLKMAEEMREGSAAPVVSTQPAMAFSAYCIMCSVDRQERLLNDMHALSKRMEGQSKAMTRLTWLIAGMTASVVVLSIVQLCTG